MLSKFNSSLQWMQFCVSLQIFATPYHYPKSQPFIDHVITFSVVQSHLVSQLSNSVWRWSFGRDWPTICTESNQDIWRQFPSADDMGEFKICITSNGYFSLFMFTMFAYYKYLYSSLIIEILVPLNHPLNRPCAEIWSLALTAVKIYNYLEPEGSLPCLEGPATGPYAEPDKSSSYHPILFPWDQ
jgi:hypothetical protein